MASRAEVYTFIADGLPQSPAYRITIAANFSPSADRCAMIMRLAGERISLSASGHRRARAEYASVRAAFEPRIGLLRYSIENLGREIERLLPGASLLSANYSGFLGSELLIWLRLGRVWLGTQSRDGQLHSAILTYRPNRQEAHTHQTTTSPRHDNAGRRATAE